MLSLRVFLTVFLREFCLILLYHFWMDVKSRPFDFLAASDNAIFDENIFWHYLISFAFFISALKLCQKITQLLDAMKPNEFDFHILWKSRCMKKYVGISLQKSFQPIIVAYLHHHGLFGCHDCQQKPLHAVHQRDPKQGKIKRSLVMLFQLRSLDKIRLTPVVLMKYLLTGYSPSSGTPKCCSNFHFETSCGLWYWFGSPEFIKPPLKFEFNSKTSWHSTFQEKKQWVPERVSGVWEIWRI